MEELKELLKDFEKRNNISVMITIFSDGSWTLNEFWDADNIKAGLNTDGYKDFLKNANLKKDENGLSVKPIEILTNTKNK